MAMEVCLMLVGGSEYIPFECGGFCCGSPHDRTCCDNNSSKGLTVWGMAGVILGVGLGVALLGVLCGLGHSARSDAPPPPAAATTTTTTNVSNTNANAATRTTKQLASQNQNDGKSRAAAVTIAMPTNLDKEASKPGAMPRVE